MMKTFSILLLVTLYIAVPTSAQEQYSTAGDKKNFSRLSLNQNLQRDWSQFPLNSSSINSGIWTEAHPLIPRVTYWGVHFVSADTGWAVGEGGAIIKTTNGGEKWIWYESGVENTLKTVSSVNGQRVIAAGDGGIILISEDGGESWASIPSGTTENIWNMQMITEQIGWMVGESSTALKTTDGGLNWLQQSVPHTNLAYWDVSFVDTSFGYICCNTGIVLKTTNGGDSWQIQQAGDTRSLFTIFAFDTLRVSAGGFAGKIIYSSDGGTNWISLPNVGVAEVNKIKFINDTTGFMAGDGIYQSTDGGMSWFYRNDLTVSGTVPLTTNLSFPTETDGYITGGEMLLAKTTDKGDSWRRTIVNDNFINVYFKNELSGFINSSQLIYTTNDGGYTLDTLDTFPYNELDEFNGMTFIDSMTGFVGYGTIYKTTDGGENWYATNGAGGGVRRFYFINSTTGWAIGGPTIYKTIDGGENWFTQFNLSNYYFTSVFFIDSLVGWATILDRRPYKTTDGGNNWIEQTNLIFYSTTDVYFRTDSLGFIIGNSKLYKTFDGGENWFLDSSVAGLWQGRFDYFDSYNIFITGTKVYRTTNAGTNWTEFSELEGQGYREAITLFSVNSGYFVASTGLLINYHDDSIPVELINFEGWLNENESNLQWTTATEINNQGFYIQRKKLGEQKWIDLAFVQGNGTTTEEHRYSFADIIDKPGYYYYRLKQIDFNGTFEYSNIIKVKVNSPLQYNLSQNYPNPFNNSTTIKYSIVKAGKVKIVGYDVLGKEVIVLANKVKEPGFYEVNFDASYLSSGVYFYRIVTEDFVNTKKMMLLK